MILHTFECNECGKKHRLIEGEQTTSPCCGTTMTRLEDLPVCTATDTPEQSRVDDGGPCDDGRSG